MNSGQTFHTLFWFQHYKTIVNFNDIIIFVTIKYALSNEMFTCTNGISMQYHNAEIR